MKYICPTRKYFVSILLVRALTTTINMFLSFTGIAQVVVMNGEKAICRLHYNDQPQTNSRKGKPNAIVKTEKAGNQRSSNSRSYEMVPNQVGYFNQVSNIPPLQIVPISITYPEAAVGEQVVINAADGGNFPDGKKTKVARLDGQKTVSFDFQVSDEPGIYRVFVRKGYDTKVVRLWVGKEHELRN